MTPDIERDLIGAVAQAPDLLPEADVCADDFARPQWARAWRALAELRKRSEAVTPTTIAITAGSDALSAAVVGAMVESVPTVQNVVWLARRVRDAAYDRKLRVAIDEALRGDTRGADLAAEVARALAANQPRSEATGRTIRDGILETLKAIEKRYEAGGGISGLPTGIDKLDRFLGGIQRGVPTIVAARPSVGKSSLIATAAKNAAAAGHVVDYYSLEDTEYSLHARLLAQRSGVDLERINTATLDPSHWARLTAAAQWLYEQTGEILVCDSMPAHPGVLAATIERNATKRKSDLICVDYFQLLRDPGAGKRSRADELGAISTMLAGLARRLNAGLLIAAQLNRGAEQDGAPALRHLKDCGQIEQDAYSVLMLDRPERTDDEGPIPCVDCYVRKNKNGKTGALPLRWTPANVLFEDCDDDLTERWRRAMRSKR